MKFSIIVPVYNVEKYLEKCIKSIVNQTYRNFEVILVDDGSNDESGWICDEYGSKYDFIKVVHQGNQGLSGARNTGLKYAVGEWIVFVDSDDWIDENMLCNLDRQMNIDDAEMYSFNANIVKEEGEFERELVFSEEKVIRQFDNEKNKFKFYFDILLQYKAGWEAWSRIFRRQIIEDNNLYFIPTQEVFAEDLMFTLQYILHIDKMVQLPEIFYYYRQRSQSLLHKLDESIVLQKLYNIAKIEYDTVVKMDMKYFEKNFYKLYFMLMNHHIKHLLWQHSIENVIKQLKKLEKKEWHRTWVKKIKKQKLFLYKYMRKRKWV